MKRSIRAALAALTLGTLATTASADQHDNDELLRDGAPDCARSDGPRRGPLAVVGLTADQRLICFSARNPERADAIGALSGLSIDTRLVGIDFRVQDGKLYGVGNAGGLYRIDARTAIATRIGGLTAALSGNSFGVDFNPAANALRIVSDAGQNLRHPFAALDANGNLNATTAVDATLNNGMGATVPGISAVAYTNNDLSATTATTLFDINVATDQVMIQSPANSGTVVATGGLTVDAQGDASFDMISKVRDGVTVDVQAFASLPLSDGTTAFYEINPTTGKASLRGTFRSGTAVIGIALPLDQL